MKWVKIIGILLGLVLLFLIGSGKADDAANIVLSIWHVIKAIATGFGSFFSRLAKG